MLRAINPQIGFVEFLFEQFAVVIFFAGFIKPAGKAHSLDSNDSRLVQFFDEFQQTFEQDLLLIF